MRPDLVLKCLLLPASLLTTAPLSAQEEASDRPEAGYADSERSQRPQGGPPVEPNGLSWSVSGGDLYQFNTSIDGGGGFSVNRAFLGVGMKYRFDPSLALGLRISSEIDTYDFRGDGAFVAAAGGTPWNTINEFSIGTSVQWEIDRAWSVFASGALNWAAETDADLGDAMSASGVLAGSYAFSRELTLGFGVLASGRLDGSVLFIPSLLIDWQVTEGLVVTNVRGPQTYPTNAGIEIVRTLGRDLSFSVGFRYEYRRFRLDDQGPAPTRGGVGTERSFPVWLRLEWRPASRMRLHLLGGVSMGERLELQDASGRQLQQLDANPAPFVALFFGLKF